MDRAEIEEKIGLANDIVGGIALPQDLRASAFDWTLQQLVDVGSPRIAAIPTNGTTDTATSQTPLDKVQLNEFLAERGPKTHPDVVVHILFFYLRNDTESLTSAEILDAFSRVRLPRPGNISDVLARCMRRGLVVMAPDGKDGQKAWQVTMTGESYVESFVAVSR